MRRLLTALIAVAMAGGLLVLSPTPANAVVDLDQCPTLAQGYHGGCVGELQMELNQYIGANLKVDDTFGPATQAAVIKYQRSMGLPADGMVGPMTKGALNVSGSVATPRPGKRLANGAANDAGKSVSECLGGAAASEGAQDYAKKQAEAKGYKLKAPGPWLAGAEMAACILFGVG